MFCGFSRKYRGLHTASRATESGYLRLSTCRSTHFSAVATHHGVAAIDHSWVPLQSFRAPMYDISVSLADRAGSGVFNVEAAIAEHGGTRCWPGNIFHDIFSSHPFSMLVAKLIFSDREDIRGSVYPNRRAFLPAPNRNQSHLRLRARPRGLLEAFYLPYFQIKRR